MDGQALIDAFEMCPGPDCLKDVIPKYGIRIKAYKALQQHLSPILNAEKVCVYM